MKKKDHSFAIISAAADIRFDKQSGLLKQYKVGQQDLMEEGFLLQPAFWRAPTDNDMGAKFHIKLIGWKKAQEEMRLNDLKVQKRKNLVEVSAAYDLPSVFAKLNVYYTINANGEMLVKQELYTDPSQDPGYLPRFGMNMIMPEGFEAVEYYGFQ